MRPKVVKVNEQNALDSSNRIVKAVIITYTVGDHGPFTLQTTQADLLSGKAAEDMNAFARLLQALPA